MNEQFRLALTCCLLTGCNTSPSPPLTQQALAGNYVYRSVDASVDKPTDHQFDHLTLKADGTYEKADGTYDLVQGGSTKARSEKTGEWNIQPGDPPNVLLDHAGYTAAQFNSIQTGRYPLSLLTWLTGYGPTLHITGQTYFDPAPATFSNSNIGGTTSVLFTAHIDGSFAYNPFGAVLHGIDVLLTALGLAHHNPCP